MCAPSYLLPDVLLYFRTVTDRDDFRAKMRAWYRAATDTNLMSSKQNFNPNEVYHMADRSRDVRQFIENMNTALARLNPTIFTGGATESTTANGRGSIQRSESTQRASVEIETDRLVSCRCVLPSCSVNDGALLWLSQMEEVSRDDVLKKLSINVFEFAQAFGVMVKRGGRPARATSGTETRHRLGTRALHTSFFDEDRGFANTVDSRRPEVKVPVGGRAPSVAQRYALKNGGIQWNSSQSLSSRPTVLQPHTANTLVSLREDNRVTHNPIVDRMFDFARKDGTTSSPRASCRRMCACAHVCRADAVSGVMQPVL